MFTKGREDRGGDANGGINDELAADGIVIAEKGEKVGRFSLESVRVGREGITPAGCWLCLRGICWGRLLQIRG